MFNRWIIVVAPAATVAVVVVGSARRAAGKSESGNAPEGMVEGPIALQIGARAMRATLPRHEPRSITLN
jgi:hypothetical protein